MEWREEYYRRTRIPIVDKDVELRAWMRGLTTQNVEPLPPEKSPTHEDSSETWSRGSYDEGSDAGESGDTRNICETLGDGVGSKGESYLESEESEDGSGDSLVDTKTKPIDMRWQSYHGDLLGRKSTLSREEFDQYRVLAEKQMKGLRQERDRLRKMYSVKCYDLRKEMKKRKVRENLGTLERESTGTIANEWRDQLPERWKGKVMAARSRDELGEIDGFADSPFESVQDATGIVRKARELRIRILLQRATILAAADRWDELEKRALEALELVGRLKKSSIEAKCRYWYGIALYYQGYIDKAAASFEQSKACLENSNGAYYRADYDEIDPDQWLRRCDNLIANNKIKESLNSLADGIKRYGDPSFSFPGEIAPYPTMYVARSPPVAPDGWATSAMDIDSNSSSDIYISGCGETGREKMEDAEAELEGLEILPGSSVP